MARTVVPMGRRVGSCLAVCAMVALCACASRGREVFVRAGCVNCHRFREFGDGGGGAPDLSKVGSRLGVVEIGFQILNLMSHNRDTRMPPFSRFRVFDLLSLIVFLRI